MNENKNEELAKKLARKLKGPNIGDEIVAKGKLEDIKTGGFYNMPCPGSAPGGMSIFGKDEDYCYIEAFCDGTNVEFFSVAQDKIVIKYGGKIRLEYLVTGDALKDYGVDLEDYGGFIEKLEEMGLSVEIE